MTRSARITILSAIAICLAMLAWLFFRSDEPAYKGKNLSYWLRGYDEDIGPGFAPRHQTDITSRDAKEAVCAIGTNAVPTLLKMVQVRDAPWKMKIISWWRRKHPSSEPTVTSGDRNHFRVQMAFAALGSNAVAAVPGLVDIYTRETNFQVRIMAASCLGQIGPAASNAVPVLLAGATSQITNGILTMFTLYALRGIQAPSDVFVPVLIQCLRDPYIGVQSTAAETLGAMGTNALSAVLILANMYRASHYGPVRKPELKVALEDAIRKIDPQTAAELGIEEKTSF